MLNLILDKKKNYGEYTIKLDQINKNYIKNFFLKKNCSVKWSLLKTYYFIKQHTKINTQPALLEPSELENR